MAPHTINTTVADRQLGKKSYVALLQIRLQQTTMLEYRYRQLVELLFNMSTIILYDTLQATPPLVDTGINEPL